MEKHDPRKINDKLRNLTSEQSKALSGAFNAVYVEAELRRNGVIGDVPVRNKAGKLLFTVRYRLDTFISEENVANFMNVSQTAISYVRETGATAEGYAPDSRNQATLAKAEQMIVTALDQWLGTDSAAEIFSVRKPFASVKGEFYFTQVFTILDGIRQQIETAVHEYTSAQERG